jgi:hypothetical protein
MTDTRTETTGTGTAASASSGSSGTGGSNGGGRAGRQKSRAAEAYESTRARTSAAFAGAGRRAGEEIESYPLAAIAGGLAIGALAAAVLPRTQRESELLGGVGTRINEAARDAARSAADAGRAQVEEITETAATKVGEAVIGAVTTAAGGSDKG